MPRKLEPGQEPTTTVSIRADDEYKRAIHYVVSEKTDIRDVGTFIRQCVDDSPQGQAIRERADFYRAKR